MNYIVLDLEWNSAYYKPQGRFINEIIQIGAVKLDEKFDIIDTFQVYIKSKIVKKLSNRTINLTRITNQQMSSGIPFREAVSRYNQWAGSDTITMTWSDSDLYAIVDNSRIFLDSSLKFALYGYLDLQSYIQKELKYKGHAITNQISLANAASMLNISTEGFELHNAGDDAYLCALMLKKTYNKERFESLIRNTSDSSFFERLFFRAYYISNINDKRINKKHLIFTCPKCEKIIKRQTKWKFSNNWLRAEFYCEDCSTSFKGMISFKQTFDRVITKKRLLPLISNAECRKDEMQQLSEKM